jgi:AraC family transcriptional regulator
MTNDSGAATAVEADMPLHFGRAQVVRKIWKERIDVISSAHTHHLELSLLPRSQAARGCFPEQWGPLRFEPIGEVFLMPACHTVHAVSNCRHQHSVVCRFEPEAIGSWLDEKCAWSDSRLRASLDIVNPAIRQLLFRIGEELRNPGFASDTLVELMAAQVAVEVSRHLLGIDTDTGVSGLPAWRLKLIDERLAADGAAPSLSELAAVCQISVRHLTRAFRASRGKSIGSYIAERRIDAAKRLLAEGLHIKSVAYATGFTAPSNFSTAFTRATGETPRQYQHRARRIKIH